MPDVNGSTVKPKLFTLYDDQDAVIRTYAAQYHDGNASAALRAIVRHFASCQFPLLGLAAPEQPDAEPQS